MNFITSMIYAPATGTAKRGVARTCRILTIDTRSFECEKVYLKTSLYIIFITVRYSTKIILEFKVKIGLIKKKQINK